MVPKGQTDYMIALCDIIVCCVGASKNFTMLYKAYCMANSAVCAYR